MASTVENTGLAQKLAVGFEQSCACRLRYIAAGSTRALLLLDAGVAAAAITHAPDLERNYLTGHPDAKRVSFMRNEFILVGPSADSAQVRGMPIANALAELSGDGALFISRADGSGTNLAELALWERAIGTIPDQSSWYRHAGVQMANALLIASQLDAYTISDSGTHAQLRERNAISSERLSKDAPPVDNIYSLIAPANENELVDKLSSWLLSAPARSIIESHQAGGQPLFTPL